MEMGPTAIQPSAETRTAMSALSASGAIVQTASHTPQWAPPSSSAAAQRFSVAAGPRARISTPKTRQASADTSGKMK